MWFFSRLRNRQRPGPPHKRPTFRPALEALEGRCLPSTLTVINTQDSGRGSLRYEIAHANNNDAIVFAPGLDGQTITLTSGELAINKNLTIQGPGAGQLTISGGNSSDPWGNYSTSRVFEVAGAIRVTLSGLAISNGTGIGGGGIAHPNDGEGGGILNFGTLTVSGCTVSGDTAALKGGGVANFGALTVSGCTLSGDSASAGYGGGIYNAGTATVSGCTLSGDIATYGGGIYNAGTLTVLDSIFSSNSPDNIFGPYTDGGGNKFS